MEKNESKDVVLIQFRAEAAALLRMKGPEAMMPDGADAFAR